MLYCCANSIFEEKRWFLLFKKIVKRDYERCASVLILLPSYHPWMTSILCSLFFDDDLLVISCQLVTVPNELHCCAIGPSGCVCSN